MPIGEPIDSKFCNFLESTESLPSLSLYYKIKTGVDPLKLSFIPFEEKHYSTLQPYFTDRPTECCESDLFYHIIWKDFYETQFCILPTGILWLQQIDMFPNAALLPISKKEHLKENFELLQEHFTNDLHQKLSLFLVDEEALEMLSPKEDKYQIVEDTDSFDYIYLANDLRKLSGKKYHKKKNHLNAFVKEQDGHYEYRPLTYEDAPEILDFIHVWSVSKDSDDEYHRIESQETGIENLLKSGSVPGLRMAGIYLDNKLEAFSAGVFNQVFETAVIHIELANNQIRGLYPFISQQFLTHAFPEAIYVNREDDMGLLSLRKAKEAYHPIKMARKFTIIEK